RQQSAQMGLFVVQGLDVLMEASTQHDVQQLSSAADTENGNALVESLPQQPGLQFIASGLVAPLHLDRKDQSQQQQQHGYRQLEKPSASAAAFLELLEGLFCVVARLNIAAAADNQAVELEVCLWPRRSNPDSFSTRPLHRQP